MSTAKLAPLLDGIRAEGWMVAVHNDYRIAGNFFTFWLFTRGDECVKGEARTDVEALAQVRTKINERSVAGTPARPARCAESKGRG